MTRREELIKESLEKLNTGKIKPKKSYHLYYNTEEIVFIKTNGVWHESNKCK